MLLLATLKYYGNRNRKSSPQRYELDWRGVILSAPMKRPIQLRRMGCWKYAKRRLTRYFAVPEVRPW